MRLHGGLRGGASERSIPEPRKEARGANFPSSTFVLLFLLVAQPAYADLASHFGMSPRTMGLGGAFTGVSDDVSAIYYNPAGLVQLQGLSVSSGVLVGRAYLNEDSTRLPMDDENSFYLHVGIPLSGLLKDHFALGITLNMPFGRQLHGRLYRKDEPYFVAYDSAVQLMQFRAGASFRIPWEPLSFLTFGASIQVLGSVSGGVTMYVPLQQEENGVAADPDSRMEAWIELDVPTTVFYTVGAMAHMGEHLRLGLAYRSEQSIEMLLPVNITARIAASDTMKITIPVAGLAEFNPKFYPQQVALGASFRRGKWLVALDLTWIDYSSYQIPYAKVTLDVEKLKQDPGLRMLIGPDGQILPPHVPDVQWTDMIVPRLGLEYTVLKWLTLRGGYFYERTPLKSTEIPSYDCDKHGFNLGARGAFLRPWDIIPGQLNIDVTVEELWYVERMVLGSEVGGHVFAFSAGVEVVFL